MDEINQRHESLLKQCIEKKYFDSTIVYRKHLLDRFFDALKNELYSGPLRKSMFISHGNMIEKAKNLGIKLHKDRKRQRYYIDNAEFQAPPPEPVFFNPEMIDIPKE